jgi:Arc/MetJ family transcription regulator
MRTNIDLDDTLMNQALRISGLSTKKGVLTMLLTEYIRKDKQQQILKYRGKNIWHGSLAAMRAMR